MTCTKIAIVEANKAIRDRFGRFLEEEGCQIEYLAPSDGLVRSIASSGCDIVIVAENMSGFAPVGLISQLREHRFNEPVVVFANEPAVGPAVEAIRAGAMEIILSSDDDVKLYRIIENIKKIKLNKESTNTDTLKKSNMVAEADSMQRLLDMVIRIAPSSATVLIQGESGTGKEVMARYIHQNSGRGNFPFVAMNCAALPENLAESELFGYEKGAFTGALSKKRGRFEQAQGGTLLLDEISEMPLPLQAKLLRVLQEKEVDRIGGKDSVSVDVRIIATTNRDLAGMVKEGQFRKDLYYRLRIIPLIIPALRERRQDIPALIDHFIIKYSRTSENRLPRFSPEAMETMINCVWPGNVRELENSVERAMLLRTDDIMGPELLLIEEDMASGANESTAQLVGMTVKELEERLILQTLHHVNENRTHAAEMLGISIRTLRNKLKEYREDQAACDARGRC